MGGPDFSVGDPLLLELGYQSGDNQEFDVSSDDDVGIESLDYDPIHSVVYEKLHMRQSNRRIYGYTGLTLAKWTITIMIGLLVGLIAFIIESSQEIIITYKKEWTSKLLEHGLGLAFFNYATMGVTLVLLSSCLVIFWAPAAAGGGVTLVMAYLNGNDIPDFFRHRTFFTKIFGTICTVSSGLPIGQEGPMVHIGGAIASELTWMRGQFPIKKHSVWLPQTWFEKCRQFTLQAWAFDFHNDKDRREFISAGAAAGLGASFGAPIGGVLFSMEEASSFWSRKVMWRSLLCTTCTTMGLSWLNKGQFSFLLPGTISFQGLKPEFDLIDLPLFVVTSVLAGVIGAFLNISHDWLAHFRPSSKYRSLRVLEACLVTFTSIAAIFLLSYYFGHCLPLQKGQEDDDYWYRYTCPLPDEESGVHYYNDLASLYFAIPRQTIQQLLALGGTGESPFTIGSLAIYSSSFLLLFILAYGIAAPVYMWLVHLSEHLWGPFLFSSFHSGQYNRVCMRLWERLLCLVEFFEPLFHWNNAILTTLHFYDYIEVVIIVEGTGGIELLLPVILAIVLSNWVAHHIHTEGAYESDLERIGEVHFLQSEPSQNLHFIAARDIMAPDVICFREITPLAEVVRVLRETSHNGFPIIQQTHGDALDLDGQLVGVMLRHQILLLLEQRAIFEIDSALVGRQVRHGLGFRLPVLTKEQKYLDRLMRVFHHSHHPHRRYLSSRPEAVNETEIVELLPESTLPTVNGGSGTDSVEVHHKYDSVKQSKDSGKEFAVDFRPWMNRAPLTVRAETSARRVYIIFRTLGLRHLCVTDASNRVVGMITRIDLSKADKAVEVDPITPRETDHDNSQSFGVKFPGHQLSPNDRTARDVLFSLP
uniref:Chloride channel protein n=1 Tax=Physcomitrium patens TaxID=3218 RepID=A0A7I4AIA6_PHYPA